MHGYRFLGLHALRFWRELLLISILAALSALAGLALPWLGGQLLAGALTPGQAIERTAAATLVVTLVFSTLLGIAAEIVSAHASGRILAALRLEAYTHLQHLPLSFHERNQQGDLLSLITWEVASLSQFLTATLARAPSMALTAIGSSALLFFLYPKLALIVPLLVPAFYLALKIVGRSLRAIASKVRAAQAKVLFLAESHLSIIPATKSFAVEEDQAQVYAQAVELARRLTFAHNRITAAVAPMIGLSAALAVVAMLLAIGHDTGTTERDPAQLFSFLLYAAYLARPVGQLADIYGQLQIARGTLGRIEEVYREAAEPGYFSPLIPTLGAGAIIMKDVSFAYPERAPVLEYANIEIAAGETIALTGENGAGKSTLISLLLRFNDPTSGQIFLDGQDIAQFQVQAVRRRIGYVPQRPLLFNGTVRENIAFGQQDATDQLVYRAARLAQALEFIQDLPQGFETQIGDHGVRLSGGQQQRLALARALLVDPQILILDEATSMYDLKGEAAFVEACQDVLRERTVLIVTHRPASLALADRIYCVQNGKVFEVERSHSDPKSR